MQSWSIVSGIEKKIGDAQLCVAQSLVEPFEVLAYAVRATFERSL
jgi:hypothetical protein